MEIQTQRRSGTKANAYWVVRRPACRHLRLDASSASRCDAVDWHERQPNHDTVARHHRREGQRRSGGSLACSTTASPDQLTRGIVLLRRYVSACAKWTSETSWPTF